MGTSSGANFNNQQPPAMLPPRQLHPRSGLHTSLSLASSEAVGSPEMQEPVSNSDMGHDSATESASSHDTWPVETTNHSNSLVKKTEKKDVVLVNGGGAVASELQVIRRISAADRLSLREVARERVDSIAERMKTIPEELLEELKNELRVILEGTGGSHQIEEFMGLQKLVQSRADLTASALSMAHRVQLEVLVAIKTGIQAFLHRSVTIPPNRLVEIFFYKRCRNIACQSPLPAEECRCETCTNRKGFCNLCMCVICNKFDFEVNTCRWIGCDFCSHWTHTDCAIRVNQIGPGQVKNGLGQAEMLFRCQACQRASELLGWVRDVFQQCAPGWDRDALIRELDFVCKIFRMSEDTRGRKLLSKCMYLIDQMRGGVAETTACRMLLQCLQELEIESPIKGGEGDDGGRLITPQEACSKIAEVVQEAVRKMEAVGEEKLRAYKRARMAVEVCEREMEEKAREVAQLQAERQRQRQQVEELDSIVRLKQAEAEMFQLKANEARQEAERLQSIAMAKSEKAEQDYASLYLKRRLEEAEAEKQYLFEKIKLQDGQRGPSGSSGTPSVAPNGGTASSAGGGAGDHSQMLMLSKIQDLLKNVRSISTTKSDGSQMK
ncbi:potyvirus VPg interacting protein (DUF1423) [Rhynchospora pubera]|uniref:OBERON-like protein n=1 Tax=Rhynchospora pubera TaxID=906938 RepID=A0AAV8D7N2_9POAL|nr:potyvirus VPg interacting protein (DUF1423) [Rhynchospora pubera]